jgi:hypothetical protein
LSKSKNMKQTKWKWRIKKLGSVEFFVSEISSRKKIIKDKIQN